MQRLRNLRLQNSWTQEHVARELGITRANYSHIETGRNEPDNKLLLRLSSLFDVSIDYLLENSNVKKFGADRTEIELNGPSIHFTYKGKEVSKIELVAMRQFLRGGEKSE